MSYMKCTLVDRNHNKTDISIEVKWTTSNAEASPRNWEDGEIVHNRQWMYLMVNGWPYSKSKLYWQPRNVAQHLLSDLLDRWAGHEARPYTKEQWDLILEEEARRQGRLMTWFGRKEFLASIGKDKTHVIGGEYLYEPLPEGFGDQLKEVIDNINNDSWNPEWWALVFDPRP